MVDGSASPARILREMLAMFASGDCSAVRDVVAADYVDHQGLGGSTLVGVEGFPRVVNTARNAFPDLRITVEHEDGYESHAAALVAWSYAGMAGDRVERRTMEILRVDGGLAREHWGRRIAPVDTPPRVPPAAAPPKLRTYLHMTASADLRPSRHGGQVSLRETDDHALVSDLHRRIGADHGWPNAVQQSGVASPRRWLAEVGEEIVGYVAIAMPADADFEITTFGLVPEAIGRKLGGGFLTKSVHLAWSHGARRVWLHTNNRDHPHALPNYLARGFIVFKIELAR